MYVFRVDRLINCFVFLESTRQNSGAEPTSTSSSTATSPKTAAVIASATASNLASALKGVFSSFGKGRSVEEK